MRVDGVVFVVAARGDAAFVDDGRRGTTVASRWVIAYCVYIYPVLLVVGVCRRRRSCASHLIRFDSIRFDSIRAGGWTIDSIQFNSIQFNLSTNGVVIDDEER